VSTDSSKEPGNTPGTPKNCCNNKNAVQDVGTRWLSVAQSCHNSQLRSLAITVSCEVFPPHCSVFAHSLVSLELVRKGSASLFGVFGACQERECQSLWCLWSLSGKGVPVSLVSLELVRKGSASLFWKFCAAVRHSGSLGGGILSAARLRCLLPAIHTCQAHSSSSQGGSKDWAHTNHTCTTYKNI